MRIPIAIVASLATLADMAMAQGVDVPAMMAATAAEEGVYVFSEVDGYRVSLLKQREGTWSLAWWEKVPLPKGVRPLTVQMVPWGGDGVICIISAQAQNEKMWMWFSYSRSRHKWAAGTIPRQDLVDCVRLRHTGGDRMECLFLTKNGGVQRLLVYQHDCISVGVLEADAGAFVEAYEVVPPRSPD